jgi:hypothetical protein
VFPATDTILARLDWLIGEATRLGPALPLAIVFAWALGEAVILPRRHWVRGVAVLLVVLIGGGAAALLHWERRATHSAAEGQAADREATETSALRGVWSQMDELSRTLPPAPRETPDKFDTVDDALASLSAKVAAVSVQIDALKAGSLGRSIDPATAARLADYLRQQRAFRVVVSCPPGDVEAYTYANQLAGILKAAGWDASGPQATLNVTDKPAMGVMVLIRDPTAPEGAKILLDAFNQMNIPHHPGISADDAIPDTATVELFVAKKP